MAISEIEAAERAEFIQSVNALLIPLSLFLACVIMAGGIFLLYVKEPLGWAFVFVAVSTILVAMTGLVRFQNRYRAKGILPRNLIEDDVIKSESKTGIQQDQDDARADELPAENQASAAQPETENHAQFAPEDEVARIASNANSKLIR